MKRTIRALRGGPDWASGHLAIVVTADEDDRRSHNRVLTVVMHPSLRHKVVADRLTHYSLTRLYDDVLGAPHLRKARRAPDMAAAFGLPVAG
jgi:acid phosphatase